MGKMSTKRKEPEEEEEEEVVEEQSTPLPKSKKKGSKKTTQKTTKKKSGDESEEEETLPVAPKPKKKAKKVPEPEPEPEPEEEEEEDEESIAHDAKKVADSKKRRNKKAKLVGYRSLARQVGYSDRVKGNSLTASGIDGMHSLISIADAKRLMRFVPSTPGSTSFGVDEVVKRQNLFEMGVPKSAARETQARCDAVLRSVMNQVVLRAAETNKKTISASDMMSVLRPYSQNMMFTSVSPCIGQVRHAQDMGILSATEKDKNAKVEEKKDNLKAKKSWDEYQKSEEMRKAALREKRATVAPSEAEVVVA